VSALDDDALSHRDEFATNDGRVSHRESLRGALEVVLGATDIATWLERFSALSVPCAPVLDVAGALSQAQIAQGDLLGTTSAPAGEITMIRSPLRIDGARPPLRSGPRRFGEDTGIFHL
jgi:crotonobetainyl-CoA:carnitine CoA-transferase CaiB-like acyl-CoA transferase